MTICATGVHLEAPVTADLNWIMQVETESTGRQFLGAVGPSVHQEVLADRDAEHVLAVTDDGTRVGFAIVRGLVRGSGSIELARIVIAREFRGRGTGRLLVQALLARARQTHRAVRVWLDVKPDNDVARSLYASEGFRAFGACPDPTDQLGSLILMEHVFADRIDRSPDAGR